MNLQDNIKYKTRQKYNYYLFCLMFIDKAQSKRNELQQFGFPIKINHYSLKLQYQGLATISINNQKRIKNRSLYKTSKQFYRPLRSVHLSIKKQQYKQKSDFSAYLSEEIIRNEDGQQNNQNQLKNKSKIKQLKQIMKQKNKLFNEYNMDHLIGKRKKDKIHQNSRTISVHSNEHEYSPHMRILKKKIDHKKQEQLSKLNTKYPIKEEQVQFNKSFLLRGGRISMERNIATTNVPDLKDNPVRKAFTVQPYQHRSRYLHSRKFPFAHNHDNKRQINLQFENDCKPWDQGKLMEEQFLGLNK